jgi:hypothetical protein
MTQRDALDLAVIMERRMVANKWVAEHWEAIGVVPQRGAAGPPRRIRAGPASEQWLHGGLRLELLRDEAENYLLNVTAPEPRVFVLWRRDEDAPPRPVLVTASYGAAAGLMDAGEQVDGVPMPPEIRDWVLAFAQHHYRPPEKRKGGRYASSPGRRGEGEP